ncbi:MAG: thioredoxin-like domain-containing protein [Bacteroidota bacterium]
MKNWIGLCLLVLLSGSLAAQTKEEAPYKKDPNLPSFNILLPDSTWFTKDQLPKTKYDYTIIIYFSPDCGHCQHEATEISKNMDSLKNAFFVFVAYKSLEDIQGFASYYQLDKFPNVRVGRDPQYYIPSFYRVTRTPYVVVYNKKGLLEKVYDPEVTEVPEARDLIRLVNKN